MNNYSARSVVLALTAIALLGAVPAAFAQDSGPELDRGARTEKPSELHSKLSVDYQYFQFDRTFSPWHLTSVALSRRTPVGSVIGRFNHARRFDRQGTQFEVDAYPKFAKGTYGYLNVGYAPESLFPEWRAGGELFKNLPGSWESSAGVRWLRFPSRDVLIYTGSVGKYVGNYWISARPFVTPKTDGTSVTTIVSARRYYRDRNNYVGASAGFGTSPADLVSESELNRDESWKLAFEGKRAIDAPLRLTWRLSYDRQEFPRRDPYNRWGLKIGFERDF